MKYILTLMLFFPSLCSIADIYKWTDEYGRVHFSDSDNKPENTNVEKIGIKTNTYTNITYEVAATESDKVIMYSVSWCGYCKKARKYFIAHNIPFTEYDIDKDQKAKRRHKNMGATGVPVILYDGKRMNGFSESGFKRIYQPNT